MNSDTMTTAPDQLFGCDVFDHDGEKIGSVDSVWVDDDTNALEFIGVKTGWLFGSIHVIPTNNAQISNDQITVPYSVQQVKDAPSFSANDELSPADEDQIYSYYGEQRTTSTSPSGLAANESGTLGTAASTDFATTNAAQDIESTDYGRTTTGYDTDNTDIVSDTDTRQLNLAEEELQVGKRQVEAGRVRLRKVVNVEHEEVPVELQRETVSIERVDTDDTDMPDTAFQEGEIDVPVMREEAVVGKEVVSTGAVRVNKNVQTDTKTVGADVRSEDVVVDEDVDDDTIVSNTDTTNTTY